jgi:hypothetical protein
MKTYTEQELLDVLKKYSRHEMNEKVCEGCNQSHHYILCPYDVLMTLDGTGRLNKLFEKELTKNEK